MTEYMVLQKISPSKILDAIEKLRKLSEEENQGVTNYYTMNIFGTWDVGVWFDAKNDSTALDFVHSKLQGISGVVDSYVLPMFSQKKGMTEYLVLLRLSRNKILEAMKSVRKIPEDKTPGINNYYVLNIFGTWDVGVWFDSADNSTALDFVHSKLQGISGVVDSYVLSMYPNYLPIVTPVTKVEEAPIKQEKIVIEAKH